MKKFTGRIIAAVGFTMTVVIMIFQQFPLTGIVEQSVFYGGILLVAAGAEIGMNKIWPGSFEKIPKP